MRTDFTTAQLADPATAVSEAVIRKCVHCGFCLATCPTYVLLGDELDSPRGRIYLIKDMLEGGREPTAEVVKHVDRCLSCLACMSTCPSGVNYMHLIDHARAYIQARYRRPMLDRLWRTLLAQVLPYPRRFRAAITLARIARPAGAVLARVQGLRPLAAMLEMAPSRARAKPGPRRVEPSAPASIGRVAMLRGCVEPILRPEFQQAATRLLGRIGYQVVQGPGEGCCGALVHHMGREADAHTAARRNIDAWFKLIDQGGLEAILVTASGCGTTIKDYGFMLRNDPDYATKAAHVSALAQDVSEFLAGRQLPAASAPPLTVAYHPACSLQHGQRVVEAPRALLAKAGFAVKTPAEAHLCCGSAGAYNILQPEIAGQLGQRKADNLRRLDADVIATSNIGCANQISRYVDTPIVHIVELLDWATGGPIPAALASTSAAKSARSQVKGAPPVGA